MTVRIEETHRMMGKDVPVPGTGQGQCARGLWLIYLGDKASIDPTSPPITIFHISWLFQPFLSQVPLNFLKSWQNVSRASEDL